MAQGTPLWGTNQAAALAGVAHEEVKCPLVCNQPLGPPLTVSLAAMGKFADDKAGLVSTVVQPDLSLFLERDNRRPNFERFQQARLYEERQERHRAQPASAKCLPNLAGMTG